jgi:hypothetical protein
MPGFKLGEKFARGPALAILGVFESLPDSFTCIRSSGDVEQTLIGRRILHYGFGSTLDRENDGTLVPLDAPDHLSRVAPEAGERLNILGDVEHGFFLKLAPF